jgi:hypothetical protein
MCEGGRHIRQHACACAVSKILVFDIDILIFDIVVDTISQN